MSWKKLGAELNRAPQTVTFQSYHVSPAKGLGCSELYLDFQRMVSKIKKKKKNNMLFLSFYIRTKITF